MTSSDAVKSVLTVENLVMRFGGVLAIDHVSLKASSGQITAIIGPNGAGKTTLFNCITRFYDPTAGRIMVHKGDRLLDLRGLTPHRVAKKARVLRTFQNIRLFAGMTVLENVLVAQHARLMRASSWSLAGLFHLSRYTRVEADAMERAAHWLNVVGLMPHINTVAGSLPYGVQRRVEIARCLCAGPRLLCLDEPAAGLNPKESEDLNVLLSHLRDEHKISILLIEHDMSVVMGISDHIVVLDYGRVLADGTPRYIREHPEVIRAYLGDEGMENNREASGS